ncbi:MAG: TonB-dependent receptor [Bacteroidales bacterium]|nr:TonB-dependent receptor [Bacteroidales bacterium]
MKRLILILLTFIAFDAISQNNKQVIDPTVEVNRDFEGKMMEITKGKIGTSIADSLYKFKTDFNYTFFNKPYRDLYEFSPVESAGVPQLEHYSYPELIAKLGIGYPLAPEANILYSPKLQGNHFLNLKGNLNMYKGDVPVYTVNGDKIAGTGESTENKEMDYGVKADYTYAWRSGQFNAYAGYKGGQREYFQKIGEDVPFNFHQLEGGFGVKSSGAGKYGQKFNYALNGDVRLTQEKPLKENLFSVAGELGPTVGRFNKFMVGIGGKYADYSGNEGYHYGLFNITPQYRYANGNIIFNLGVKIEGKFTDSNNGADQFHNTFFPAADISLRLLPDKLWLYGKVDGWNSINAWSDVFAQNNFISTELEHLKASSVPVHAEAGFQGRITDKFSYRIFAGYAMHKGLQQFVYDLDSKHFTTFYSNNSEFAAGGEFDVTTEPFQGGASFRYASFSKGKKSTLLSTEIDAIGFPQLQGSVYGKYNWNKKFYIGVQCNLQGEEKALCSDGNIVAVDGFADLQATVEYAFNPALTVWLRGENLLDAATQYTPFYQRETRGILAGIIVKL